MAKNTKNTDQRDDRTRAERLADDLGAALFMQPDLAAKALAVTKTDEHLEGYTLTLPKTDPQHADDVVTLTVQLDVQHFQLVAKVVLDGRTWYSGVKVDEDVVAFFSACNGADFQRRQREIEALSAAAQRAALDVAQLLLVDAAD